MKNYNLAALAIMVIACTLWITACQDEDIDQLQAFQLENANPADGKVAYDIPTDMNTLKPNSELTKDWWRYVMGFDCEHNPLYNDPASPAATGQNGPVKFLVAAKDGPSVRNIIAYKNQTLVVPVINNLGYVSCTEPDFQPTPGHSLEQVLKLRAQKFNNLAGSIRVTLDGKSIAVTNSNRITTDLFYFKVNADLENCFQPCLTGGVKEAVSDGYWVFIKGLTKGNHTLHLSVRNAQVGNLVDATYRIAVP